MAFYTETDRFLRGKKTQKWDANCHFLRPPPSARHGALSICPLTPARLWGALLNWPHSVFFLLRVKACTLSRAGPLCSLSCAY